MEIKDKKKLFDGLLVAMVVGLIMYLIGMWLTTSRTGAGAMGPVTVVFMAIAGICGFIFWLAMLIQTAKEKKWAWFVAILLVNIIGIAYYFAEYRKKL